MVKSYNLTRLAGMLRGRWLNVFFNNLTRLAGMLRGRCLDLCNLTRLAGLLRVSAWIFTI